MVGGSELPVEKTLVRTSWRGMAGAAGKVSGLAVAISTLGAVTSSCATFGFCTAGTRKTARGASTCASAGGSMYRTGAGSWFTRTGVLTEGNEMIITIGLGQDFRVQDPDPGERH